MHFHFPFTTVEVLWTLTFAAQLVLLVVLLGRERMRRFPWFTASIVILALRALSARVLFHRLPELTFSIVFLTLADVGLVLGLLVLLEMARVGFRGVRRPVWIATTLVALAIAGVVLAYWGAWPAWKTLTANSRVAVLLFMQLAAQKGQLLLGVLSVELGILVVLFGRRYHAGWRTHVQRIVVGLSTAAMAELAVSGIWEIIVKHVVPKSREQYEHILDLRDKITNANSAIYLVVLIWWIACLWMDEPGAAKSAETLPPVKKTFVETPTDTVAASEASPGNQPS
ncbi:MAG: hypothetical protein WBE76_21560 [Terracidiphilus sp.]